MSLNEYKERLNTLSNTYEKEIQEIKEELKKSKEYINRDKKDKSEVMKKFSELTKEKQKYIKEKEIIEQELNKKEQELANNKTKIIDLEYQIKLLKKGFDDLKKSIDLKNKENDELRNVSKENNEAKIKRSNIIDNIKRSGKIKSIKKMCEDSSTPTTIPQSVRKRDDKVRTFAPKEPETYQNIEEISYLPTYDEKSDRLEKLINEYNYTEEEKYIFDPSTEFNKINPKHMTQLMKNDIFYKNELEISNARIKYLDKII